VERAPDLPLEMLMLMPAAALGAALPTEPKTNCGGPRVEAHLLRDGFEMIARGWFDAAAVLKKLRPVLASCPVGGRLRLDFAQARGFDHLALSALVVVLRDHCRGVERIVIAGLEPRCLERLAQTGAENLLGAQWRAVHRQGEIAFLKTQA